MITQNSKFSQLHKSKVSESYFGYGWKNMEKDIRRNNGLVGNYVNLTKYFVLTLLLLS